MRFAWPAMVAALLLQVSPVGATTPQLPVSQPEWHDTSPHRVRFIEVEPGIRLEVLDWGGRG